MPAVEELLPKLAAGDEHAFSLLFKLYWRNVYVVALDFTKSEVLAEEITQDVFLKIWQHRDDLSSIRKFDDYLFIVARNHIYNVLRKKSTESAFIEHLEAHFLETSYLSDQGICFKETRDLIDAAVELLPPQQRAVFLLSRNEGLNHNQIAEKLGISTGTIKSHMNRALHSIRAYLQKRSGEEISMTVIILLVAMLR
jgi:RNA polymerase sigma-70 factor (ECF subfamily)